MKPFKEFQFCWPMVVILLPIIVAINLGLFRDGHQFGSVPHLVFNIMCFSILLLFYAMTTRVEADQVIISYGIGLIRKRINVSKLKNIDLVQNPFIYGWGIRLIPNGWLYNITGSHAIELQFNDLVVSCALAVKILLCCAKRYLLIKHILSDIKLKLFDQYCIP